MCELFGLGKVWNFGDKEGYFDGNPNLDLRVVNWVLCLWKRGKALMGVFVVGFHGWVWFLVKLWFFDEA